MPLPTEDLAVYGKYIIGATADIINLAVKDRSASKASPGSLIAINSETGSVHHIKLLNFPEEYQINANGITLFNNETLYVISHSYSKGGESIFVFQLQDTPEIEANFLRVYKFEDSHGLYNSITVKNPSFFYLTQSQPFPATPEGADHSFYTSLKRNFMTGFTKSTGTKLCAMINDTAVCQFRAMGYMSNGIAYKDQELFVADSITKTIQVFDIGKYYELKPKTSILLPHNADNLQFFDGALYVTGMNRIYDFMKNLKTMQKEEGGYKMPGGVSRISFNGEKWIVEEIIMQDKLNFPSSCAVIGNQIFISSVVEPYLLRCTLE